MDPSALASASVPASRFLPGAPALVSLRDGGWLGGCVMKRTFSSPRSFGHDLYHSNINLN